MEMTINDSLSVLIAFYSLVIIVLSVYCIRKNKGKARSKVYRFVLIAAALEFLFYVSIIMDIVPNPSAIAASLSKIILAILLSGVFSGLIVDIPGNDQITQNNYHTPPQ